MPGGDNDGTVFIKELRLEPGQGQSNLKGEFHTFQREDKPSSKIKDVKVVFNGDSPSDIYVGTIYKNDEDTPTETWYREGITEEKELLEIMGQETMLINANPSRVFEGDIFGYIKYISIITINNIEGVFMPIAYSYDAANNITSLKLKQVFGSQLEDVDYQKTFDYGTTVKPTIRG